MKRIEAGFRSPAALVKDPYFEYKSLCSRTGAQETLLEEIRRLVVGLREQEFRFASFQINAVLLWLTVALGAFIRTQMVLVEPKERRARVTLFENVGEG